MHRQNRPNGLLTLAQVMGAAAIAVMAIAIMLTLGAAMTENRLQSLCLAGAMGCALWLLAEFIGLCGRVKRATAFTPANVHALGRISLAFALAGALLIPAGGMAMAALTADIPGAYHPLMAAFPTFAALTAALLVRAVQLLLRRAADMQTEQDLTI